MEGNLILLSPFRSGRLVRIASVESLDLIKNLLAKKASLEILWIQEHIAESGSKGLIGICNLL